MSERRLIVTADDAGLHPAITAAVLRGHRDGIVTAASLVANGIAFNEAAAELRDVPTLALGAHLTLVEERPLLPATSIPSLVGRDGRFHHDYRAFVLRYATGRIRIDEVESEWRAQLDTIAQSGVTMTHLNSHQHLHLLPALFDLSVRLAREYRIDYVRVVDDRGGRSGILRSLSVKALSALGRRAARRSDTSRRSIGVLNAGHLSPGRLQQLLKSVDGDFELVSHPAIDDAALSARYAWGYEWESELRALVDRTVRDQLVTSGIRLVTPGDVSERS